jgi:hypothetical protein
MRFFNHETKAHQDSKIRKVIRTHGVTGYGIYWLLLEKLYSEDDLGFQIEANELWLEDFAESLHISDYRTLIRVFDTFSEVGLISKQLWQEHILYSDAIAQRGDNYVQKKIYEREKKRKQRSCDQVNPLDVPNCPLDVPRDNSGHPENSVMSLSHIHIQYSNSQSDPKTKEENTRSENIYTDSPEIFFESDLPTQETLISDLVNQNEETTPPTPSPLPPENVGLAIAENTKPQKAQKQQCDLNLFLQVWNQDAPSHWVRHTTIDSATARKLTKFANEFENSLEMFQKGLWFAQTDTQWCMKLTTKLKMTNVLSRDSNLIFQFYQSYEDNQRRLQQSPADRPMTPVENKMAHTYSMILEAIA